MLGWGIWHYMREVRRVELETTQFFVKPCGSKKHLQSLYSIWRYDIYSIECPHHLFQTWHLVHPQQTVTVSSPCQLITNKCNITSVTECKMLSLKMIDSLDKSKLRQTKWCPNIKWKLTVFRILLRSLYINQPMEQNHQKFLIKLLITKVVR